MPKTDWFTEAFGSAVADVRAKLIEEAWFGRSHDAAPWPGTRAQPEQAERAWPGHSRDQDHGIDR